MATLEAALVALLVPGGAVGAIVGTRVYPVVLPQTPLYPSIRYQRIDTVRGPYRKMATGRSEYARPRFQIDCFATTAAAAQALADAVRSVLDGFSGTSASVQIGSVALEDEAADAEPGVGAGGVTIYRHRLDFVIGHAEA